MKKILLLLQLQVTMKNIGNLSLKVAEDSSVFFCMQTDLFDYAKMTVNLQAHELPENSDQSMNRLLKYTNHPSEKVSGMPSFPTEIR